MVGVYVISGLGFPTDRRNTLPSSTAPSYATLKRRLNPPVDLEEPHEPTVPHAIAAE